MEELKSIVRKLTIKSTYNLEFKHSGDLYENSIKELRDRLPNLEEQKLLCLAAVMQNQVIKNFTNEELDIISNAGLEHLQYEGHVEPLEEKILSKSSPGFDIGGVLISEEIDRVSLHKAYKRALTVNKSLNESFIANYITNLG